MKKGDCGGCSVCGGESGGKRAETEVCTGEKGPLEKLKSILFLSSFDLTLKPHTHKLML